MVGATQPAEHRRLTLGVAAPWLRRTVGPIAWSVIEALAERAELEVDRTVSHRSVRDLAAELRLANDTVARAMRRLAGAGLLHHEAGRQASGRFSVGRYVLSIPPHVFEDMDAPLQSGSVEPVLRCRASKSTGEQLALLPET
jgi:hypothetical protein